MFSQGIHGMIRPWTVRESELNGSSSVLSIRLLGSPEDEQLIDSSLRANRSSSWIDPSSRLLANLWPTGAAAATSGARCSKLDDIESTKGGRGDSELILCGSNGGGSSLRVSLSLGCTSSGLIGARLPRIWTGNCCKHSATSLPTHSCVTDKKTIRNVSDNKYEGAFYVEDFHVAFQLEDLLLEVRLLVSQLWQCRHILIHET